MKIAGSHALPVAPERAYQLLQDPEILARCMPGTERLALVSPDEYEMKMKMVISAVQGLFAGKVRIADQKPPGQFRLIVEGSGKVGFMRGDGLLSLAPGNPGGTEVHYEGEVHVGGVIAGVGQRLLDTTAKIVIRKFFEKLVENSTPSAEAAAASVPSPPPTING